MTQTTSKRLTIAMFAVLAAIIVGLAATLIVFAATGQNISSSINVSYTAEGIYGKASATYKVGENGTETAMKNGTQTEIIFNGGVSGNSVLNPENVTLTSRDSYVVFKYVFTNNMDKTYYADMTYTDLNGDDKNITTTYSENGTDWIGSSYFIEVPGSTTDEAPVEYYVKVAVTNKAKDATYTGTINWNLDTENPVQVTAEIKTDSDGIYAQVTGVKNADITTLTIPSKIKIDGEVYQIGGALSAETFSQCQNLEELNLTNSISGIKEYCFSNNKKLKTINIIDSNTRMFNYGFAIDTYAFANCTSLTTVRIECDIWTLDRSATGYNCLAFEGCSSFSELIIKEHAKISLFEHYEVGTYELENNDYYGIDHPFTLKVI